jgi:hypothetical protein
MAKKIKKEKEKKKSSVRRRCHRARAGVEPLWARPLPQQEVKEPVSQLAVCPPLQDETSEAIVTAGLLTIACAVSSRSVSWLSVLIQP